MKRVQRVLDVKLASNICRAAVSMTNMASLMYFVQWVCNCIAHMYKCTIFICACSHMSLCPIVHMAIGDAASHAALYVHLVGVHIWKPQMAVMHHYGMCASAMPLASSMLLSQHM